MLRRMWTGEYSCIAPRTLKKCVGKFAPQFNGYSQHDTQELLAFLLDGLHEDLNKVIESPLRSFYLDRHVIYIYIYYLHYFSLNTSCLGKLTFFSDNTR